MAHLPERILQEQVTIIIRDDYFHPPLPSVAVIITQENEENAKFIWSSFIGGSYLAISASIVCKTVNDNSFGKTDEDLSPFVPHVFKIASSLVSSFFIKASLQKSNSIFIEQVIGQVSLNFLFNIGYSLYSEGVNLNIPYMMINSFLLFSPNFVKDHPILAGFSSSVLDNNCAKLAYNTNEYVRNNWDDIEEVLEGQLNDLFDGFILHIF